MVEQPAHDREPNPDDANDAQLPGPEDGPLKALPYDPLPDDVGDTDVDVPAGIHDSDFAGGE